MLLTYKDRKVEELSEDEIFTKSCALKYLKDNLGAEIIATIASKGEEEAREEILETLIIFQNYGSTFIDHKTRLNPKALYLEYLKSDKEMEDLYNMLDILDDLFENEAIKPMLELIGIDKEVTSLVRNIELYTLNIEPSESPSPIEAAKKLARTDKHSSKSNE